MIEEEQRFGVGDVVRCNDKVSVLYLRDSVVVYSSLSIFGVISDGLNEVFFITSNDSFELANRGHGRLNAEQETVLQQVLAKWPLPEILGQFPKTVEAEKNAMDIDANKTSSMTITGRVPYQLIQYWRKFEATLELSRRIHPEIPQDVGQLMMEWMLISMLKAIPTIVLSRIMRGGNPPYEGGGQ